MKKENDFIINRTSKEFPMKTFYGNVNPVNQKPDKPIIKLFPDLRNGFNNESPDFFRMDSMKENETSYKNPYLNVVKTVNRSLYYKNNQSCIEHIKLINKVKSKRELSQNPKILKQICYSTDINILENNLHKESKTTPYMYRTINCNFEDKDFVKKIKTLNGEYLNNHSFIIKNCFDMKKINENQISNNDINIDYTKNHNNNNYDYGKNEGYKNEGNLNLEKMQLEENQNHNHIHNQNQNQNKPQGFRNTVFAFNKFNIKEIKEDDMERGVEKNININYNLNMNNNKNNNMNFMTMYHPKINNNDKENYNNNDDNNNNRAKMICILLKK
jgi:hypothetical protein